MSYRRWRTQEGAAELRREEDRLRGAARALEANLLAWDARACPTDTTGLGPNGTADPKLRWKRISQEVVVLPKPSIIQQYISTSSRCTVLCLTNSHLMGDDHIA